MINLKKVFIGIISVLLIATIIFVALYDSVIDNCMLEVAGIKYEKDDFVKYYKLVAIEEGSEEIDVSDVYEQYVAIKVYLQKAQQHKLALSDDEIKSIEENYDSDAVDKTKLEANGITKEEYLKYYEEVMLASKFIQDAGEYYQMSETDYETYKSQYSDGFKMYNYRILQVIPTATGEGDGEEKVTSDEDKQLAKSKAEEALEKIKSGEDFEEIAQEYGSYRLVSGLDGYTLSNGQLETMPLLYLSESVTNTQLYNELIELADGEYTNIVEDGDNYLFAKLESTEDGLSEAAEERLKSDINTTYAQSYIANNTQIIRYLARAKNAVKDLNIKVIDDVSENDTDAEIESNETNENDSSDENNSENVNENLVTE